MLKLKLKSGNILQIYILLIFMIFMIVLIAYVIISKYYIESKINLVKKDLFYIGQDSAKSALDISKLSYSEYEINNEKLISSASKIIDMNYGMEVKLDTIKFLSNENKIYIKVILKLKNFLPFGSEELNIPLDETMKLKLMEVE